MDGETTTLTKAHTKTQSLRTTVPSGIIKQFNLKEGDILEWKIRAESRDKLIIVVRPIRSVIEKV